MRSSDAMRRPIDPIVQFTKIFLAFPRLREQPYSASSANTTPDGPHASGLMSHDPFYQGIPGIFSHFL
ncbi:hypothetical protein [Burkholderia stagnalis]|uniref:hypothetical protein n=1 Tax=Burkholderia stagnalis TaxID=1503054 RepID=UPI0012D9543F|nr:hypothetical protein [Burkholderia stagnalis]